MHARQTPPRRWLMTDERMGDGLWRAVERLPRGAGIVLRHYATPASERRALFLRLRHRARARGLLLIVAGDARSAAAWRADGVHSAAARRRPGLFTAAVHDRRELAAAIRARADLVFVSPVFATRSHPGARPLGRVGLAALVTRAPMPVIALGGMDGRAFRRIAATGAYGWAGIDAWLRAGRKPL